MAKQAATLVAVDGRAGVGTSRLALEYAWRRAGHYEGGIFWIAAGHIVDKKQEAARRIGKLAGIKLPEVMGEEEDRRALFTALVRRAPCLIVLDGVPASGVDGAELERWFPPGGSIHVLATVERALEGGSAVPIDVGPLALEAAAALLSGGREPDGADERAAREAIVERLAGLPLGLEVAGALMRARAVAGKKKKKAISRRGDGGGDPVRAVLAESVAALSDGARASLQALALLGEAPVTSELLASIARRVETAKRRAEAIADGVAELERLALVGRDLDGALLVHRLVREVVRDESGKRELRQLRQACEAELLKRMKQALLVAGENDGLGEAAPHAEALAEVARREERWADAEKLASSVYAREVRRGLFDEARKWAEIAHEAAAKLEGKTGQPLLARAASNLAGVLLHLGRAEEARPLLETALRINEKLVGRNDETVAVLLHNLAQTLRRLGQHDEAHRLLQRALRIKEKALGPHHPEIAIALNSMATLLFEQGRGGDGLPLLERALAIDEKALGPEHPTVAVRLRSLAALLFRLRRASESLDHFRRALAIQENALGREHPEVGYTLTELTAVLVQSGRALEAIPVAERAVSILGLALGEEHPNARRAQELLAAVQSMTGWH